MNGISKELPRQHNNLLKTWASIIYGGFTIWTGLLRGIEAGAYKPNSLWFCMVMGLLVIAAAYLFRLGRTKSAQGIAAVSSLLILLFYLSCFIGKPEDDATVRVGLIIVASIVHLAIVFLPPAKHQVDS